MSWSNYRSAPPPGTVICAETDLASVRTFRIDGERGAFPLIVVRGQSGVRAFVNACPHQYLPLDYQGSNILSADGTRLMCTAHGAQFDAVSGQGVAGEGLGCALDEVPVALRDGMLVIAAE